MSSATRSLERETKFDADLAFRLPPLEGAVRTALFQPGQELRTSYFDTSDLRLWRRGLSLRHRRGDGTGAAGTWTLKVPSAAAVGREGLERTEVAWPGDRHVLPTEAARLLHGVVRRAVLVRITELSTVRRRFVLHDDKGVSCGELDDDTVTVIGGRATGLRFRQLEVEFSAGCTESLSIVERQLRRAGARRGDTPKLAIVLGEPSGPGRPARHRLGRHARLDKMVRATLSDALDRLVDNDLPLRLDPAAPPSEVIHQARVAARRLRSDLLTLRPVLDHLWIDHTRAELAWLGTVLGAVRDVDVLAGNLDLGDTARPDDDAGRSELDGRLGRQREAALTEVACALDDERYIDLLDRIHGASTLPPFSAAGGRHGPAARAADVLPSLVRRQWWKVRRRVHRAGRHPSDRQLHRIRIGAKQLRYAAEMATPVVGPPARRTARAAERLQDLLGRHHDAVTADAWLRGEARRATPAGSFTAGLLSGVQRRRQRRYRRRWSGAWARLGDRKRHRWLRS